MQDEEGKLVDLYIPRKCSATNRLITAKDHASIQLNIAHVDEEGHYIRGHTTTFALCGYVRRCAESDAIINRLAQDAGFLKNIIKPPKRPPGC